MESICEKVYTIKFITKLVSNYTKDHKDLSIISWNTRNCQDVVGYQGQYFRMNVKYKQKDQIKILDLFIKSMPKDEAKAKILTEVGYFKRESGIYSIIFEEFDKYQENQSYRPRCALTSNEDIILEDVYKKGYKVRPPRNAFDKSHCLVALKSLAQFHAASIIYEEMESEKTGRQIKIEEKFKDILKECGYVYEGWYVAGVEAARAVASQKYIQFKIETENILKWRQKFKDALNMCRPSKTKRNVICHRDLWANNLMINYNEKGLPVNCIFVDFQACIYMPPTGDLVSLIYLNLERQHREEYYDDLIKFYYERLKDELMKCNLKIDEVYMNYCDFLKDCDEYKLWGLVQAVILHQLALLRPEDSEEVLKEENYDHILNVSRNHFVTSVLQKDSIYRQRLSENVEEFVELFLS